MTMKTRHIALALVAMLVSAGAARAYGLSAPSGGAQRFPITSIPSTTTTWRRRVSLPTSRRRPWRGRPNRAPTSCCTDMGRTSGSTVTINGKNEVFLRNASKDNAAATTYWWSDGSNRLVEADIVVWDATYTFFSGDSGCSGGVYLQDIITHELGHALGLAHSSVGTATMYPVISWCSTTFRSLDADDLAGIEKLYPSAGANTAPTVTITAPATNLTVTEGTSLTFAGSAIDIEDGALGSNLVWVSSQDSQIGSGSSFERVLSVGVHTITARVTDSSGATNQSQRSVTVTAVSPPAPSGFVANARGYKVKGVQCTPNWFGAARVHRWLIFTERARK